MKPVPEAKRGESLRSWRAELSGEGQCMAHEPWSLCPSSSPSPLPEAPTGHQLLLAYSWDGELATWGGRPSFGCSSQGKARLVLQ